MDIKQINSAIMFGSLTNTELESIIDAVKFARGNLARQNKQALRIGARVKWRSPRNPFGEQGTVEKIATKFVTVKTDSQFRWKVPANMLEFA